MTTAKTPNADNHANLDGMASRFVQVAGLPWESTNIPGVESKTLLFEKSTGLLTVLMRMAPGAELPPHTHMQIEQTYVLEGHLVCGEGECRQGDFVWRPAGSSHKAWSPDGGLFLSTFQVPNMFMIDGGEKDMLGQDWYETWGNALNAPRGDAA